MRKTGALALVFLMTGVMANCTKQEGRPADASRKALTGSSEATALEQAKSGSAEPQAGPAGTTKPRIVFDQKEYDFGKVEEGEKVEKSYSFRNTGDGTLVIRAVRSG